MLNKKLINLYLIKEMYVFLCMLDALNVLCFVVVFISSHFYHTTHQFNDLDLCVDVMFYVTLYTLCTLCFYTKVTLMLLVPVKTMSNSFHNFL